MYSIEKGRPILGCHIYKDTIQWGIFSSEAVSMCLKIYQTPLDREPLVEVVLERGRHTTGHVFHIAIRGLENVKAYTWQASSRTGKVSQLLVDPYSKGVIRCETDQDGYRNLIVEDFIPDTARPKTPWEETIIYEMHVGYFTQSKTAVIGEEKKGTFLGLMEQLPYLKSLGVTAIELLPVFKWNPYTLKNKHPKTGELLKDEWGYNTVAFFALQDDYAVDKARAAEEFLELIEEAHEMGIEVLLDVVYNHTGEGGEGGTLFNFKALGDEVYYKKINHYYMNCAGTGNVLNATHIVVKDLILDSLRYWVTQFGIDGFRFDLASILQQDEWGRWVENGLLTDIANDPILSSAKLITESWDAKGSYDVGRMPEPCREWSDFYRDTIRKIVRGDMGMVRDFARCIVGQDIQYANQSKGPFHSVHFITAHDGFTMWDLVSYNSKHNELNGEQNRDGSNNNYSYNCGIEGDTDDESIRSLRFRRMKNYFAILLLSKGVPMLLMGDEVARSQGGNNNAFCQDNEGCWMQWTPDEEKRNLHKFVKYMIAFRKEHKWFKSGSKYSIKWHGVKRDAPDWSDYSCSLAWELEEKDERIFIIFNSYIGPLDFEMPKTTKKWLKLVDTDKRVSVFEEVAYAGKVENVAPYSLCIYCEAD